MPKLTSVFIIIVLLTCLLPAVVKGQEVTGERIYVLGAVNKPGDYEYQPGMDVKQAIELAGGLAPNADPTGAVLAKENKQIVALNLQAILSGHESVPVSPGDTIAIKPGTVTVNGQVMKPGVYDLKPGMTAGDALVLAGGATEAADLSSAYVTRAGSTLNAGLGTASSSLFLQANDILTIPGMTASITGEVNQPGTYPLVPGQTDNLSALIEKAGGVTSKADLSKVRISSVKGDEHPTRTVDTSDPAVRQTIRIQGGDAVFIPLMEKKRGRRISLNDVYQAVLIIYTLTQIFK